jgi:hypothetical protein
MTKASEFFGGGQFPARPQPLAKKINASSYGLYLPSLADNGTYVSMPSVASGSIALKNTAGATVWTVAPSAINAACGNYTGMCWLDVVDQALWVWAIADSTTPDTYYLARINMATGAVTNVGTCQPGDGLFQGLTSCHTERAAMGAGNFTIWDGDYTIVISSTTGAIVTAATQITQSGQSVDPWSMYHTADDSIVVTYLSPATATSKGSITLQRGGTYGTVFLNPGYEIGAAPIPWAGYVALGGFFKAAPVYGPRFFTRTEFDLWLRAIADYLGLPS